MTGFELFGTIVVGIAFIGLVSWTNKQKALRASEERRDSEARERMLAEARGRPSPGPVRQDWCFHTVLCFPKKDVPIGDIPRMFEGETIMPEHSEANGTYKILHVSFRYLPKGWVQLLWVKRVDNLV